MSSKLIFLGVKGNLSGEVIDLDSKLPGRVRERGGHITKNIGLYHALGSEFGYKKNIISNPKSNQAKVLYDNIKDVYKNVALPTRTHIVDSATLLMNIEKSAKARSALPDQMPEETFVIKREMVLFCTYTLDSRRSSPYYQSRWDFVHKGTVRVTPDGKIKGLMLGEINVANNKAIISSPAVVSENEMPLEDLTELLDSIDNRIHNLEAVKEDLKAVSKDPE